MSWSAVRTVAVLELRQRVRSTRWRVMLVVWGIVLVLLCGGMASSADASVVFFALRRFFCWWSGSGVSRRRPWWHQG